jgi:hypothetical protein
MAKPTCSIDGCGRPRDAKGFCQTHYRRMKLYGDPMKLLCDPAEKRAWIEAAAVTASDECLDWPWGRFNTGYGQVRWNGRPVPVHSIVCEIRHGRRPAGMDAAHHCGRRICCNGSHLRWATRKGNVADRVLHGTDTRGEAHPTAKLREHEVLEIRRWYSLGGITQRELAQRFGVSGGAVFDIIHRKTWAHLD